MNRTRGLGIFVTGALLGVGAGFASDAWSHSAETSKPFDGPAAVAAFGSTRQQEANGTFTRPATTSSSTVAIGKQQTAAVQAHADSTSDLPADTPEAIAAMPPTAVNELLIPVVGVEPADLVDTFTQARSQGRVHDAIDIMAPRGTPVVAANDGRVVKLFTSKRGGLTVYQFDPQNKVIYYYAHLDRYATGLAEGQSLHRGDPIGLVGSTGNASADAPHLHFEIEMMGPKQQWWHGTSIDPYGRFAGQPHEGGASTDAE